MKAFIPASVLALGLAAAAHASPVNGTGLVTPDVIFGSGNANGSWTGQTANNIEVAMRGKLRYNSAGIPENTFNYDGDHTYTFAITAATPGNRSTFNFEWSINVDQGNSSGLKLDAFVYVLSFDIDPSAVTNFISFNPFGGPGYFDHSLGDATTPNGGGIEATDLTTLLNNMGLYEVAQQSSNLGFGFSAGPPGAGGIYDFQLSVLEKGTTNVLSSAAITIVATPLPAALPMLAAALGLAGLVARRRRA